ncbi:MAG TPA: SDR family oxidoreductase [Bacillota bacterium]|nr:SDR family oxidoreductase [Bacillota bacterium]
MEFLQEKTAIITGASSGIGQAIAEKLAEKDAYVVLLARREKKLAEIVTSINENAGKTRALAIRADVTNVTEMERAFQQAMDQFGAVDFLVNNAGIAANSSFIDGEVTEWGNMIDVNVKGVLHGIHTVLPHMLDRSSGHIINVASVSGFEVTKRSGVYSATKFAVRALSMGLEKELARTGVRVTNISPGMVDTDLSSRANVDRKILQPEDIAEAVIYAVKQPDYVNVNEITVRPV